MAHSLLPPNETSLVLALEQARLMDDGLWSAWKAQQSLEAELPFVIWELGLEELSPYIENNALLIQQGRIWQQRRGTPYSIELAAGWIDLEATIDEEPEGSWWDCFQLDIKEPTSVAKLEKLFALSDLSKASHCKFVRVYAGWDIRPLGLDEQLLDGGGFLEDWSGEALSDGQPVVSMARFHANQSTLDDGLNIRSQTEIYLARALRDPSGSRLDWHALDETPPLEPIISSSSVAFEHIYVRDTSLNPANWPLGRWDDAPWGKVTVQRVDNNWSQYWPMDAWAGSENYSNFSGVIDVS